MLMWCTVRCWRGTIPLSDLSCSVGEGGNLGFLGVSQALTVIAFLLPRLEDPLSFSTGNDQVSVASDKATLSSMA